MLTIKSAEFIKGAVGPDNIFLDDRSQFVFIGRSNVGKSSLINSICGQKGLARISALPGRTREINLFLLNNSFYLIDLPGYGYAKVPLVMRKEIEALINWYLFLSDYKQRVVFLIIDAYVLPTADDLELLSALESHGKNIVVIANKIDKIKPSLYSKQMQKINQLIGDHQIIPYSTKSGRGLSELILTISKSL